MKKENKMILKEFENHARPVDMANYIILKEILAILKDIKKELK